jgi:hypothetical protein
MRRNKDTSKVICSCGCGGQLDKYNKWGYKRKFIHGHNMRGKQSGNYRGGRTNLYDYILVLVKNHPYCDMRGYVFEHRLVMEKHLGRYLKEDEYIHHIDHNPKNNNINNLLLMSSHAEHRRLHIEENRRKKIK